MSPVERVRDPSSPKSFDELDAENQELRSQLLALSAQLEELKKLNSDRAALGRLRECSVPARVVGGDTSSRQMLTVVALQEVPEGGGELGGGMPVVVAPGSFVGRVVGTSRLGGRVGGGLRVQLTTDPGSKIQGRFVRWTRDEAGNPKPQDLEAPAPLVTGELSTSPLRVMNLSQRQVEQAGIAVGDWVAVDDTDFRTTYENVQGLLLGKVASIGKSRVNPLMADIVLEPPVDFRKVREVMVVVK
jgi:cell shape-determining protein MreC